MRRAATGIPVDGSGGPTIDPTLNVLQLVEAAVKRVDDLRASDKENFDNIRQTEASHIKELLTLRTEHSKELAAAESKRIDAIRVVDVQAVSVANEKASDQAGVLAAQVATSAEALRALVDTNARTLAQQLTQLITPITDRLSLLEKAQNELVGKTTQSDPILAQLAQQVNELRATIAVGAGRSTGVDSTWKIVTAIVASAATLIFVAIAISGHLK